VRRRDLLGALAAGLLGPALPRPRRRAQPDWRFELDGRLRWSLVPRAGAPAVARAEVAVRLEGADWTGLAALDRVRRFAVEPARGGSAGWQVVGILEGVEVTAAFLDGPPPTITVTARGLGDDRPVAAIRFLDSGPARVAGLSPARGGARLLVNGERSASDCVVVPWDGTVEATGFWQLAVLRESDAPAASEPQLALAFAADDAGEGTFRLGDALVVESVLGRRLVGMTRSPATATLAVVPGGDPLDALARLAGPSSGRKALAGWTPGTAAAGGATEDALLAGLEAARRLADPQALRVIVVGDGFQRSAGDWETNERFPHGHRWLTDRIHAAGFQAGLWLAPFAAAEPSGIPVAHPEWLQRAPGSAPRVATRRDDWGGAVYALDAAQPAVQDYLRELVRHVVNVWGYDLLELGALGLGWGAAPAGASAAEAYRAGLRALREGAGDAFVLGADAPLQHSGGLVDAMRLVPGVAAAFDGLVPAARNLLLRAHLDGAAWVNDGGAAPVGAPLSATEARAWASVVALCGVSALATDALDGLDEERLGILRRIMPVAPVRGRPLDLAAKDWAGFLGDSAPAWLLAAVADDWWMLAGVNWDDEPRRLSISLADHGLRGPLAAWDVWEGARRADVDGRVTLDLPPHGATVLSLRRPRRFPYVLGSSRHVVQGLMDLEDEQWDARLGVLSGRAVLLDGQPYEIALALPPGFVPSAASCDPAADVTVEVVDRRSARVRLANPPAAAVDWSVVF